MARKNAEIAETNPSEALKAELDELKGRITTLKQNMAMWNETVPADRRLLEQLMERQAQIEAQIQGQEPEQKAA